MVLLVHKENKVQLVILERMGHKVFEVFKELLEILETQVHKVSKAY